MILTRATIPPPPRAASQVEKRFLKDGDPPASTITKKDIMRFG
jgi:hypothetical protein